MTGFKFKRLQELVKQLLRGPTAVRRRNAARLEELLLSLGAERLYPYEFIHFRITGFRPKEDVREVYPVKELLPDLLQSLKTLSRSVPRAASELPEKVYTLQDICNEFKVSARTVRRWQRRGLVAAVYLFPDGKAMIGVRHRALESFLAMNPNLLQRRSRFSRLTRAEEKDLVIMARRYARDEGLGPTAVAARVAAQMGRARETVRKALLRHDHEYPAEAVFAAPRRSPKPETRRRIYADYRQGVQAEALGARYSLSRSSIYRIINQERAAQVLAAPLTYHYEDRFADAEADDELLGKDFRELMRRLQEPPGARSSAATATSLGLGRASALSKSDEEGLFRAYNYAKFRVCELRRELNPRRYVPSRLLEDIQALEARAEAIRDLLVKLHLPPVEQMARQHATPGTPLAVLLARGRSDVARLVDSFDYRGRVRLWTRARLELLKSFARAAQGGP